MYAIAFTAMQMAGLRESQAARVIESLIQPDPDSTLCSRPGHPGQTRQSPDVGRSDPPCGRSEQD